MEQRVISQQYLNKEKNELNSYHIYIHVNNYYMELLFVTSFVKYFDDKVFYFFD